MPALHPDYTAEIYAAERAICDKARAYADARMAARGPRCNYLEADEAKHPDYAACDNEMRGRVEAYELLRDLPDDFGAYLEGAGDGVGSTLRLVVWTGRQIGTATVETVAKPSRRGTEPQRYGHATMGGKRYRWQGKGIGMFCRVKAAPAKR